LQPGACAGGTRFSPAIDSACLRSACTGPCPAARRPLSGLVWRGPWRCRFRVRVVTLLSRSGGRTTTERFALCKGRPALKDSNAPVFLRSGTEAAREPNLTKGGGTRARDPRRPPPRPSDVHDASPAPEARTSRASTADSATNSSPAKSSTRSPRRDCSSTTGATPTIATDPQLAWLPAARGLRGGVQSIETLIEGPANGDRQALAAGRHTLRRSPWRHPMCAAEIGSPRRRTMVD
jgi:hypothetical protein